MKKLFILGILVVIVIIFIFLISNNTLNISFKDESDEILFLAENENWLAKIKVIYDPRIYYDNEYYYTREYYYLEYIGKDNLFEKGNGEYLEYKYHFFNPTEVYSTGSSYYNSNIIQDKLSSKGKAIECYPDEISLELNYDGKTEKITLTRKEIE